MAEIRLEGVEKRFKDIAVIGGLDLTIHDGEFFTFVGPSGCGKSTILNMIAGLEPVTGGSIYFDDVIVNELSPKDRDVAMVFQNYALYPHMNVFDNMAFPLKMKKTPVSVIDEEVKRISGVLNLEELLLRKPRELSGGQRQRVALGRAIIRKPKVFLMDEPLSNLDARLRIEMRAELKKLHQDLGITTVYVTHDQGEALSLSSRIAVLHKGEVQQCGSPVDVYLRPSNMFVGGFIGSPSMNFIHGKVQNLDPLEINCNGIIITPNTAGLNERKNLCIGLRPEDIVVSGENAGRDIEVSVSLIELSGSFNWVDFTWGSAKVKGTSKLDEKLGPGDKAFMSFPHDRVIIFDEDSGERVRL